MRLVQFIVSTIALAFFLEFANCDCIQGATFDGETSAAASLAEVKASLSRDNSLSNEVEIEAHLVFAGPKRSWFAVQQGNHAIRVTCAWTDSEILAKLPMGTVLRIKGNTVPGTKDIRLQSFQIMEGKAELTPTPIWENFIGRDISDYALVETEVLVNEFYVGPFGTVLLCHTGILPIRIEVESASSELQVLDWLHSKIIARGCLTPIGVDPFSKYSLYCMSHDQIQIKQEYAAAGFRTLRSKVLYSDHLSQIIIENEDGIQVVRSALSRNVNPGELYDVYVHDALKDVIDYENQPTITGFLGRGKAELDEGRRYTVGEVYSGRADTSRVLLNGEVKSQKLTRECFEVQLVADGLEFSAAIPKWQMTERDLEIRIGDTLEVTGTPLLLPREGSEVGFLKLHVANKSDFLVVRRKAESISNKLLMSLVLAVAILAIVASWSIALRAKVQRRTRQLAELSLQFRELCNTVQDAMIVCDKDGRVINVNSQFIDLFGFAPPLNSDIPSLCKSMESGTIGMAIGHLFASAPFKPHDQCEVSVATSNRVKRIECRTSAIMDSTGKLIGALWSFADVSEKRLLEEKMVAAQRMEIVGQLAGGMAHDFNNILTVIKANLFICRGFAEHIPRLASGIELARKAVDSAERLTRDLLDFSKRTQLNPEVVCLREFMTEVHALVAASFGNEITFDLSLDSSVDSYIHADSCRLQQVVINLCLNARDAIRGGEGQVLLELKNETFDGVGYSLISVADNGEGIADNIKDRIFEPFFSTKPHAIGTGLGLSVALGLVEQMGGSISFETAVGRGTTFFLRFPCVDQAIVEKVAEDQFVPVVRNGFSHANVMVVDDDARVLAAVSDLFSSHFSKVSAFSNGQLAIEELSRRRDYEYVFLDVFMSDMCGLEVAAKILETLPRARIVFMSGSVEGAADLMRLRGLRGHSLLRKPFDWNDVMESLFGPQQVTASRLD